MWSSGRVCVRVAILPGILVVGFGAMRYGEDHTIATKWNRLLSQGSCGTLISHEHGKKERWELIPASPEASSQCKVRKIYWC